MKSGNAPRNRPTLSNAELSPSNFCKWLNLKVKKSLFAWNFSIKPLKIKTINNWKMSVILFSISYFKQNYSRVHDHPGRPSRGAPDRHCGWESSDRLGLEEELKGKGGSELWHCLAWIRRFYIALYRGFETLDIMQYEHGHTVYSSFDGRICRVVGS